MHIFPLMKRSSLVVGWKDQRFSLIAKYLAVSPLLAFPLFHKLIIQPESALVSVWWQWIGILGFTGPLFFIFTGLMYLVKRLQGKKVWNELMKDYPSKKAHKQPIEKSLVFILINAAHENGRHFCFSAIILFWVGINSGRN